jgi:hypothetical protein
MLLGEDDIDEMGAFGFSWQEKLAGRIGYDLGFINLNASTQGAKVEKMVNARNVAIQDEKISATDLPTLALYISNATSEPQDKALAFLQEFERMAKSGEAPIQEFNAASSLAPTLDIMHPIKTAEKLVVASVKTVQSTAQGLIWPISAVAVSGLILYLMITKGGSRAASPA